jgi:hypothetical protein
MVHENNYPEFVRRLKVWNPSYTPNRKQPETHKIEELYNATHFFETRNSSRRVR